MIKYVNTKLQITVWVGDGRVEKKYEWVLMK